MNRSLGDILRHSVFLFIGVLVAAYIIPSITYTTTSDLIYAALVLAVLNALLKPLMILFVLPFIIFTLGLGLVLVNAALLYLASAIVPGFELATFTGAVLGAIIISIINGIAMALFLPRNSIRIRTHFRAPSAAPKPPGKGRSKDSDVIDV